MFRNGISESLRSVKADIAGNVNILPKELTERSSRFSRNPPLKGKHMKYVKADIPGRMDIISKELTETTVSHAGIPRYRENV